MRDYLENILYYLPKKFKGSSVTPAANHLFNVNTNCKKLSEDNAQLFHALVDKLLFLGKRACPDILTTVYFLTTQVREPDEDDKKKLARALKYLDATKYLVLTIKCDGTGSNKWWVDAAFVVHHNIRSHTGVL